MDCTIAGTIVLILMVFFVCSLVFWIGFVWQAAGNVVESLSNPKLIALWILEWKEAIKEIKGEKE